MDLKKQIDLIVQKIGVSIEQLLPDRQEVGKMTAYVECSHCLHQWKASGSSLEIKMCPNCQESHGKRVTIGTTPEWWKGKP